MIRLAGPGDVAAIARLHHEGWHATYAALAPPGMPEAMTEAVRVQRWTAILAAPGDQVTLVVEDGGEIAGFLLLGPASDPVFAGRREVKHLFVGGARKGRGHGRRLMAAAARLARDRGSRGIGLGVVEGNAAAVAFYAAIGGIRSGIYTDPGPRWRSRNVLFVWDDLARLAALAPA